MVSAFTSFSSLIILSWFFLVVPVGYIYGVVCAWVGGTSVVFTVQLIGIGIGIGSELHHPCSRLAPLVVDCQLT